MEATNLRHLTREEQLEWYIAFLIEELKQINSELKKAKDELDTIKEKGLSI